MMTGPDGGLSPVVASGWLRPLPHKMRGLKRAELVSREIVEEILERGLIPGDLLPRESAMLERYGVGRGTVREALRLLETQGLVTLKPGPGGGPVLTEVDATSLGRTSTLYFRLAGATYRELCEALVALTPWLAELAAKRPDRDVTESALVASMNATDAVRGDAESIWRKAPRFHEIIHQRSGNLVLSTFASALSSIFVERVLSSVDLAPRRQSFFDAHVKLAEAIAAGRPEEAHELARLHEMDIVALCEERVSWLLGTTIEWH